jgi:endonuclease/exonuclease/phosphatase family metal-dependent hydrolase
VLTAASYNIHQCVGTDGKCDPQRVADVIHSLNADIVGLQEVDFNPRGETKSHQLDYLAKATGMSAIAGPTIRRVDAEFGNALLTSRKISNVRHHDVSVTRRQPRGVIDAEIALEGQRVRVLATHLGLAVNERRRQAEALLKILMDQKERYDLTLVLGDINEWRPRGFATGSLDTYLGKIASPRTFPAFFPLFALDRIWVAPHSALVEVKVPNHPLVRLASDHRPILATVHL